MFKFPYRPCPMCRNHLTKIETPDVQNGWDQYNCDNCGSQVYVRPFAQKIEAKDQDRVTE